MIAPPRIRPLTLTFAILAGVLAPAFGDSSTLADFQAAAARHHLTLSLPDYPRTPGEIKQQTDAALAKADAALAKVAAEDPTKLTFARTFAAVDAIVARVGDVYQVTGTVAQSAVDPAMRDTANEMSVKIQEWNVGLDYRADLYRTLKQVADSGQPLDREQQRLVNEQMRSYRRAGLALPEKEREIVERLRKDLATLNTQFAININEARAPLDFTAEELAGVPQSFLDTPGVKQPDGKYRVMANITWHATVIGENADNPDVRRKVLVARSNLARLTNTALVLAKLVRFLRAEIAQRLGYASRADYQDRDPAW